MPTLNSALDDIEQQQQCTHRGKRHHRQARRRLRCLDRVRQLDCVASLGATDDRSTSRYTSYGHRSIEGEEGHTGCVNALAWSSDGTTLATGSDDTRICLWKIGQDPRSAYECPSNPEIVNYHPAMGMGLAAR